MPDAVFFHLHSAAEKLWWLTGVNLRDCLTHCHAWRMLDPVVSKSVPDLTEHYVPGLLTLHIGYDMAS